MGRGEYWDAVYRADKWNYLFSPDELRHYLILLGYIIQVRRARSILDAECGAGRPLELLLPYPFEDMSGLTYLQRRLAGVVDWPANTLTLSSVYRRWSLFHPRNPSTLSFFARVSTRRLIRQALWKRLLDG